MLKENVPLQIDLFTGQAVDARTRTQKQTDQGRQKPQQIEMFAQREIAQFGVRANPHLPLSEHTRLVLIREDPRTEEEIERDQMREAEQLTGTLFSDNSPQPEVKAEEKTNDNSPTIRSASHPAQIVGFRALQRRKNICVRTRTGY